MGGISPDYLLFYLLAEYLSLTIFTSLFVTGLTTFIVPIYQQIHKLITKTKQKPQTIVGTQIAI